MDWFIRQLLSKVMLTFRRTYYYFITLPTRFKRLFRHLAIPFELGKESLIPKQGGFELLNRISLWFLELFLYLFDIIAVGEIYGSLLDWIKFSSRRLKPWEIKLVKTVYGDSIRYNIITVDENAILGVQWPAMAKAYVSFNTINTTGTMENGLLLHEMVHIWQYHKFGSPYLLKALLAQNSKMQYDYGGASALKNAVLEKLDLLSFNFEQQGDLVQDYYRIKNGYRPLWGKGKLEDLQYYEYFIRQLQA